MKQTVRTKNYNAVIEIPYEKLARKSNCIGMDTLKPEPQGQAKTLLISNCHGCCTSPPVKEQPAVSLEMLEELERAFEVDMKEKDVRIEGLEREVRRLGLQLTDSSNQRQKFKGEIAASQTRYLELVRSLKFSDDQFKKWKGLHLQKEAENQKLEARIQKLSITIQEFEKSISTKNELEAQLKTKIMELEEIIRSKDKEIQIRLRFEKENQNLNRLISGYLEQISGLSGTIKLGEQTQRANKQTFIKMESQIKSLKETIEQKNELLKDKDQTMGDKQLKIEILIEQMESETQLLGQRLAEAEARGGELEVSYNSLDMDYKYLHQKTKDYEVYIDELVKQLARYRTIKSQLETTISRKQEELKSKESPKLYEVKIEKVIDRQDHILGLERELDNVKRVNLQLVANSKELEKIITIRDKDIRDARVKIEDLETVVRDLRAYIAEKEKSFAWTVEREITKDIQISQGQPGRTYKVYPGEIKVPSSPRSPSRPYGQPQPHSYSQFREIILNPRVESGNILEQLSESNELREAIEREARL